MKKIRPFLPVLTAVATAVATVGDIPEVPEPRPTCELPCPPGCECSFGLRRVERDDYKEDDEPSGATVLPPANTPTWTMGVTSLRSRPTCPCHRRRHRLPHNEMW